MEMRAIHKTTLRLLCLLAALSLACSDDTEETADLGTKDMGQQDTGGGSDGKIVDQALPDAADPDTGAPDTSVPDTGVPDQLVPDALPTSTYWKIEQANLPNKLYGVLGKSKTEVYAVGANGLIMQYNSSTGGWTSMTNPDTGKAHLRSLFYHGTQLYAFGDKMYLKQSGTTWSIGYTATTAYNYNFQDAWGKSTGNIYACGEMAVGTWYALSYKENNANKHFRKVLFQTSNTLKNYMFGMWGDASSNYIVAVGDQGAIVDCTSSACITTGAWNARTSGTTNNLKDVHGFSSKDVWAAGLSGTVLNWDGTTWKKQTVGTSSYFYGIWGTSKSNLYVVGHPILKPGESIYHYNGTKWTKLETPGSARCNGVWGSDADNVWVVCDTKILRLKKKP